MNTTGSESGRGNPGALARARAQASARKYRDVVVALARASDGARPLTVSSLADEAGVSRQFLYSRQDLMDRLRRHQENIPDRIDGPLRAARSADLVNALSTIKRLKTELQDVRHKLDAGLAAQIELRDEQRLRVLYEQRGHEVERLLTQNADLTRTVRQLREVVRSLEDDLTVERTALREISGLPSNVTDIRLGE